MTRVQTITWAAVGAAAGLVIALLFRSRKPAARSGGRNALGWGAADDIAQAVSPVLPHEPGGWGPETSER